MSTHSPLSFVVILSRLLIFIVELETPLTHSFLDQCENSRIFYVQTASKTEGSNMVQLVCPCLNIRVHGKGLTPQLQNGSHLKLSVSALSDNFFTSDVYDVTLDLGGVTKAQKLLCTSRSVEGWVITMCTGCELDIYAKHVEDNDRVIVSSVVEKEPNRIASLMESDNYSVLFKMILPEINDNYIQNNIGIELTSGNLDQTVEHVQSQVSCFLRDEQKVMEERIRQFAEQAHARFSALQQRVRKHKQAMVYLLIRAKGNKKPFASTRGEPMTDSPLASPVSPRHHSSNDSSSSTDSAVIQNEMSERPAETKVQLKSLRRAISNPSRSKTKGSHKFKYVSHSIDVGGVFDMEGFDVNRDSAPFDNSDDDTDISESSMAEDPPETEPEKRPPAYATSLPMSVPAMSCSRFAIEEEKAPPLGDPDQIAASMRALAQSVHDGTEMFGDLPRRRLNTGELLRSRPA